MSNSLVIKDVDKVPHNHDYKKFFMHRNIRGWQCWETKINPVPTYVDLGKLRYRNFIGDHHQKDTSVVSYTVNQSLPIHQDDYLGRVINNNVLRFAADKYIGLKKYEVFQIALGKYRPKQIADINFCRWLVEDSLREEEESGIIHRFSSSGGPDKWFYCIGTLVFDINCGWQVLAARRNSTQEYVPEIMSLEGTWDGSERIVLFR